MVQPVLDFQQNLNDTSLVLYPLPLPTYASINFVKFKIHLALLNTKSIKPHK
jgi:hypothetical protein